MDFGGAFKGRVDCGEGSSGWRSVVLGGLKNVVIGDWMAFGRLLVDVAAVSAACVSLLLLR
jgi:hypothetical protein